MKEIDSSKIVSFEDANLPNEPYVFVDGCNNKIVIRGEIQEEKHSAHDSVILKDPQLYSNIGYAVCHFDEKKVTLREDNRVIKKFKFNNILPRIDHPAKETMKNMSLIIAVEYNENGNNHVVTYYDKPGGALW